MWIMFYLWNMYWKFEKDKILLDTLQSIVPVRGDTTAHLNILHLWESTEQISVDSK